ncbi:MAG: D-alanyl-D-alanine carboxypeptidase [Pseudomonadota bacterium]
MLREKLGGRFLTAALAALLALGLAAGAPAMAESASALAPLSAKVPAPRSPNLPPPPPASIRLYEKARISGVAGWEVRDLVTGEVLDAWSADRAFVPASVAKLPTAAFALDRLGPAHRFETRLLATARPAGGTIEGDLVLAGGGDPELDSDDLWSMAQALRAQGVTRLSGRLIGDSGPIGGIPAISPSQPEDAGYNPGVSGLSLNFNRVRVEWPRGGGAGTVAVRAQADGRRPLTQAIAIVPTPNVSPVLVRADTPSREVWQLNERALRRAGGRWLPVQRPAAYTADVFAALIEEAGAARPAVAVEPGSALGAPHVLARHQGRPLAQVLQAMLFHSTNVSAELVGLAASGAGQGTLPGATLMAATTPGSTVPVARLSGRGAFFAERAGLRTLPSSAAAMNDWAAAVAGFEPGDPGFRLANHSGLSLASRISPTRTVDLLVALARPPGALDDARLPGGVGQLLRPHNIAIKGDGLDHARIAVAAKTGTMSFVRGLAGYVHTASGRKLAFAIYCNDLVRREDGRGSRGWTARARAFERALLRQWIAEVDGTLAAR